MIPKTVTSFEPVYIAGVWFFASHCMESQSIVVIATRGMESWVRYFTNDADANLWIEQVATS